MNEHVKSQAFRFGTIAGGLAIAYTLLSYLTDLVLFSNFWAGILFWVVTLVILIIAVSRAKALMGGYISFKNAFSTFVVTYVITSLISTAFSIILFNLIDPAAGERVQELLIETSVGYMEQFGTPEGQIEAQVEQMEAENPFGIIGLVKSFFWGIFWYAIIGLIVAAFMKKNKPVEFPEEAA